MFRLDMLPAAHGDCLWLEYGDPDRPQRVLVDAGPTFTSTYQLLVERIRALPSDHRVFELFVITHVDADHIGGAIRLLRDAVALGIEFKRIWFNGYDQLAANPTVAAFLGAAQGEYLSLVIADYEAHVGRPVLNVDLTSPWVGVDPSEPLPRVVLPGDLEVTVLSPTPNQLITLAMEWKGVIEELGFRSTAGPLATIRAQLEASKQLRPLIATDDAVVTLGEEADDEPPEIPATHGLHDLGSSRALASDQSPANGSSIALLVEHTDGSVLLAGDAFAPVLAESLSRLNTSRGRERLRVGALKLPHHGSAANVSAEMLSQLSTKHYLVSTSGAQFGHPHSETIDAILAHHHSARGRAEFWFNYDSETTRPWQSSARQSELKMSSHYPAGGINWRA